MAHNVEELPQNDSFTPHLILVKQSDAPESGKIVKFISPTTDKNKFEAKSGFTPRAIEQGQIIFRQVSAKQDAARCEKYTEEASSDLTPRAIEQGQILFHQITALQEEAKYGKYKREDNSGLTAESLDQGQMFFQQVTAEQEKVQEEAKLQELEQYATSLKAIYKIAEEFASHCTPDSEKIGTTVLLANGHVLNQEAVKSYAEAYMQKRARTVAALLQLHDVHQLPQDKQVEEIGRFQKAWSGEADEFITVYKTLDEALQVVSEAPSNEDDAFTEQRLSVIDLISSTYHDFKNASYGDIKRKFIADKEKTPEEKEFERRKNIITEAEELLRKPDMPENQQIKLLEIAGNSQREAKLRRTKVKVAWALTAAFSASAEFGGIGASTIGLAHPFVPNLDKPLGVVAFIASYAAFYGISYLKARRNLELMKKTGWSNSGPSASAYHHSDGVLTPSSRDKLAVSTDVGYYIFWDLLYGSEALAHAAATVAANAFGVIYTAGVQILPTEAIIRVADIYNNYRSTKKIKRGEPLKHPDDYRKLRMLTGAKTSYKNVEYRLAKSSTAMSTNISNNLIYSI